MELRVRQENPSRGHVSNLLIINTKIVVRVIESGLFSQDDLTNIVEQASRPLPNRPDGVVTCIMYSSTEDWACKTYDGEYDR